MFGISTREIIIIAIVLVLFFGAKKIPELAKGIADAVKALRSGFSGEGDKDSADNSNFKQRKIK